MKNLLRSILRVGLEGFGFGALLYGAVIAGLHVAYNRLDNVADSGIVYLFFALLYGVWAAMLFGGVAFLGGGFRTLRPRRDGQASSSAYFPGIFLFNLVFWELFFLYGLTYDQVPAFARQGPGRMVFFLLVAALAIAAVVFAASWVVVRTWRWLAQTSRLRSATACLLAVGVVATGLGPLLRDAPARLSSSSPAAHPEWTVRDTGLKVVFVGLDGADWRVLRPMIEDGELPTFERMLESGASADLKTLEDANSAIIWATIFTGVERQRHGVEDFYRIELPGLGGEGLFPVHRVFFNELTKLLAPMGVVRRTLITRYSHRAVPWWEVADQAGLSIGVVDGYLMSFPAYRPKTPGGYFVSYGADAFSSSLAQRGANDLELFLQPPTLFRGLRESLESGGDFVWQANTLGQLLKEQPHPRLLTFYTHEPDSAQHKTWKAYQPERFPGVSAEEIAQRGGVIPQLHRDFDGFLADLRQAVGPETVIVVASDHGHSPTLVHKLYTQHRHGPPGILLMDGGPVRSGLKLTDADVYDLFPTLLYLLGLPVPEDGPGRVLEEALDPTFLERFPVETIPSYDFLDPGLAGSGELGEERNRQELEKLKSLGYI